MNTHAYVNEATRQFHEVIMLRAKTTLSLPLQTVDVWDFVQHHESHAEAAVDIITSDGTQWELSVEWSPLDVRIINWLLQKKRS
jgi:hypothetical protein